MMSREGSRDLKCGERDAVEEGIYLFLPDDEKILLTRIEREKRKRIEREKKKEKTCFAEYYLNVTTVVIGLVYES